MSKKLALLGVLMLAACGPSKLDVAQQNYEQCLAKNAATPSNCEGLRGIYEIERRDDVEWRRQVERDRGESFGNPSHKAVINGNYPCANPGSVNCN